MSFLMHAIGFCDVSFCQLLFVLHSPTDSSQ